MKAKDTWQMVEQKLQELHKLTEEAWEKEEWELAALGERTLKTVEQSKMAVADLKQRIG